MVRSLEQAQVETIRAQRAGGCALRQIQEHAKLNWHRTISLPIISRIASGELYSDCGGPRLTPAQARKVTLLRKRIASTARRKVAA